MSAVSETTRLKIGLSHALDRIESDERRIAASEAYIKKLEQEKEVSERVLEAARAELAALYRLRELDKEEAARLRNAISFLETENTSLRETVTKQDRVIIKQNEEKRSLKKMGKILFVVGAAIGLGLGLKIGGKL